MCTNTCSASHLAHRAAPSLVLFQGGVNILAYAAAKGGFVSATKSLANEWTGKIINLNAVALGYVETDIIMELRKDDMRMKEIVSKIPAGR